MSRARRGRARPVWRRLLTATPVGWAIGIVAGVAFVVLVESTGLPAVQSPLVLGVALGLGTLQYRALRPAIGGRRRAWIVASCIGLTAPFVAADAATLAGNPLPFSLVGYAALGGVLAGVLQWRVLRSGIRRATGWLVAAPLGCFAATSTVWLNERALPPGPGLAGALQYLAVVMMGGVVFGIVTAIAAARFEGADGGVHGSSG